MKEHDWMKLYADAEKFMKKVGGTEMQILRSDDAD